MRYKAESIESYKFKPDEGFLVDTNVWIYINGAPYLGNPETEVYSKALAKILDANSKIFIDVLIVSEFINTLARIKWKLSEHCYSNFKDFRKSGAFKPIASGIAADTRRTIKLCSKLDIAFSTFCFDDLLDEYAQGDADFNDQVIVELCKNMKLKLITHDGDFKGKEVSLLTANRRLLL